MAPARRPVSTAPVPETAPAGPAGALREGTLEEPKASQQSCQVGSLLSAVQPQARV